MFYENNLQSSSVERNDDGVQVVNSNADDSENSENSPNRINMIISYGKELLCIIAFILTTFASVQNSSPKISRAVTPVPFFPKGSLVEDYYYGQLNQLNNRVGLSELSFVLYYAPWCSESQHSRAAYDHVARLFHREAYFSAINCWQPGSECRNQYTKIHSWPILMAYQRNGFGIQYQKNLWTEGALTKFITSLLHPIERLSTPDDLLEMMTSKDAMVVAFIDLKTHSRHYQSYYHAALKFLERDPFNEIGFAVVTGESSLVFGVDIVPSIRAYLWNETIEYFGNATWTSKEINKWVNDHLQQVSLNLSPPGTKTSTLSPYLKQGPVLILFTPRNFYTDLSDSYVMLQQIGMEYYNCEGDNWVQEMAREYLFERRKENRANYEKLHRECRDHFQQSYQPDEAKRDCDSLVSVSIANLINSSKNFEGKFKNAPSFCGASKDTGVCGCQSELSFNKQSVKYSYKANKKENKFQTSMLDNEDDDRSPESIDKYNFRRKCEMLMLSERKSKILFMSDDEPAALELVSGLACKSNKTFTLIAIDSVNFHTFAERLGIDILEVENKTTAIIMDQETESTYLLDEPVNLSSLTKFLYRFHRGALDRFLRTNSVLYKHTHFFDIEDFLVSKKKEFLGDREIGGKKRCHVDTAKRKAQHVVITEINSEDFENVVLKRNKTVVVLFFSANCAFCSLMMHSVMSVSRVLDNFPDVEYVRIDGDKNDLPWQYTVSEYPSLIVFPATAKSESRRFPSKMPINVTNVLGFILANLNRPKRLLGLVMACNYKRQNSTNDCIVTIQEEITEAISFLLGEWRKNPRRRTMILRFIRRLKELYLNLFAIKSSCDFIEIESDVRKLMEQWQSSLIL